MGTPVEGLNDCQLQATQGLYTAFGIDKLLVLKYPTKAKRPAL
ncbi:hypothetical protein N9W79_00375 [bacterium]|nr:hypothetical protein [bacterium]